MKPIRVLQVVTIMNRGGLETMLMNYYRKMDRSKIQFDFMTHRQEHGDYDDEIEELGGKIYRMSPIKPGNYRKYFKELEEFFKRNKEYLIVHSHINENSGLILKKAKEFNIPCRIAHSHLSDLKIDYKFPFRLYGRLQLKDSANEYFACSEKAGYWLFENQINKGEKIQVLKNAVDSNIFKFNRDKRELKLKELQLNSKLVIGHVGRFNPQKNHDFIIEIFNEVYKKNKNAVLLLIGDGYLRKDIENKVAKLNLVDSVKFMGVRSDIANIMQAMDIFLFPSLFEGLPVVLIEAQAAGLKCIVSDTITKESDISGNIKFLNLKIPAEKWADIILNTDTQKENNQEAIIKGGYDSSTNTKWLLNYYLNKVEKVVGN